jgi:hypothetical protein
VRSIKAYSPSMLATGWREASERKDESDREKCNADEKGVTPEKINHNEKINKSTIRVVWVVTDPKSPPEGEGGDEIVFFRDLCVCICKKVWCVSAILSQACRARSIRRSQQVILRAVTRRRSARRRTGCGCLTNKGNP